MTAALIRTCRTQHQYLMPLYVIGFCLLWSASFVAGKIGVTECPPLDPADRAVPHSRRFDPRICCHSRR